MTTAGAVPRSAPHGAPHNASEHNRGPEPTERPSAMHHGRMRDEATGNETAIGALVRRAVEGDEQATHDLLAHVHPLAERYCRTRLSRLPGDARHFVDDLAQEVCLAVLCALPRYRDQGRPFEAFVFGIAAHKVADLQRAAMRGPGSTAVPSDEMPETAGRLARTGGAGAAQQRRGVGEEAARQPPGAPAGTGAAPRRRGAHRGGDRSGARHVTGRRPGRPAPGADPAARDGGGSRRRRLRVERLTHADPALVAGAGPVARRSH